MDQGVEQPGDLEQGYQPEYEGGADAPLCPGRECASADRVDSQPAGQPVVQFGQSGFGQGGGAQVAEHARGCQCRESHARDGEGGGDAVMLPVDGAGVGGEQDRGGHEVVVDYLEGAVQPPGRAPPSSD